MSDFQGMEDLLQDFLVEATDLLSGVNNKLVTWKRTRKTKACSTTSSVASTPSRAAPDS